MVEMNSDVPFGTRGSELRLSHAREWLNAFTQVGDVLIFRSDQSFTVQREPAGIDFRLGEVRVFRLSPPDRRAKP